MSEKSTKNDIRLEMINIPLFGILSGRPFMARTAPFLSLGNSELHVLPEL